MLPFKEPVSSPEKTEMLFQFQMTAVVCSLVVMAYTVCSEKNASGLVWTVLLHDEFSVSASGLHAVAGVVREARVGGLPLPSLDLDSFGPRVCLDAEEVRVPRC